MTVNNSRSLNGSLSSGSTDGKYRKVRPDTEVADHHGDALIRENKHALDVFFNYGYADQELPGKLNPGSL